MFLKDKTSINEISSISNQIVNLTHLLAYRFQLANDSERILLTGALTILNQAQAIAETNKSGAQKLYSTAYRMASMVRKGKKNVKS